MRLREGRVRASRRVLLALGAIAVGIVVLGVLVTKARWTPSRVRARLVADMDAGRLDRCKAELAWLEQHDRLNPPDLVARAKLARIQGRLDDAVADLARIDDRDVLAPWARLIAGQIELERHRTRPAEAAFLAALKLKPDLTDARLELIRLYSRQQRHGDLDAQFNALAGQNALDFSYLRFWSMTRNAHWDASADVDALRQSVAADPDDRASRLALAEALRQVGNLSEAAETLAPLPTSDIDAQVARAQLALDQGDLATVERILDDGPREHAGLASLRGQLALKRHDPAAAVEHFRVAHELDPDDRPSLFGLATALKLTGDAGPAERYLEAMRRLDAVVTISARLLEPDAERNVDLLRQIGAACEAVGRETEARAWYHKILARDPLNTEAQRALFRLRTDSSASSTASPGPRSEAAEQDTSNHVTLNAPRSARWPITP